jgi:hypothetical protein
MAGGGGCTWPGGMHRGGRGDARASCASPLGTPLIVCKEKGNFYIDYEAFKQ